MVAERGTPSGSSRESLQVKSRAGRGLSASGSPVDSRKTTNLLIIDGRSQWATEPVAQTDGTLPVLPVPYRRSGQKCGYQVYADASESVLTAAYCDVEVIIIGRTDATSDSLRSKLSSIRRLCDFDLLVQQIRGSYYLIGRIGKDLRVQGTISGLRRVFFSQQGRSLVIGSRESQLARLLGSTVEMSSVLARIACDLPPSVLSANSSWTGIECVSPGYYLRIGADGHRAVQRWWSTPDHVADFQDGARSVAEELDRSVCLRTRAEVSVGADLSGGLDSTTLSALAARRTPLLTVRWAEAEQGNDDTEFAAAAMKEIDAEHIVLTQNSLPAIFAHPTAARVSTGRPYLFSRTAARARFTARRVAERGVRMHLAGHGGDEVFGSLPGYVRDLRLSNPGLALAHLRAFVALRRWSRRDAVKQFAARDSPPQWWLTAFDRMVQWPPPRREPNIGWGLRRVHSPPWVSPATLADAREHLKVNAQPPPDLEASVGVAQLLDAVHTAVEGYAGLVEVFAEEGVSLEMPFLDDHVINAALAVPAWQRAHPWEYKPLLKAAVGGVIPRLVSTRSTKGEFGADVRAGLRQNRAELCDLIRRSDLVREGHVDPSLLERAVWGPRATNSPVVALESLVGTIAWLQAPADEPRRAHHA